MKKYSLIWTLLLCLILFISCAEKQTKNVTVYGSSKCSHCTDFMEQLDSAEIAYEFKDLIIEEKQYDKEMLDRIEKSGYRGNIQLPVIAVKDEIFVRPTISKIVEAVK